MAKSSMLSCASRGGSGPAKGAGGAEGRERREAIVEGSIGPSIWAGLSVSSSVPGGWMGSYSEVASVPASFRMIFEPPGCSSRKSARERDFSVSISRLLYLFFCPRD